jgi:hypothetical protein
MLSPLKLRSLETKADLFGSSPPFLQKELVYVCAIHYFQAR